MNIHNEYLTISQLSSRLKVSTPTLRYWEKEFPGILVPLRTKGGQRRYTTEHIAIIEEIHTLKKAGLRLAEIKQKLRSGNGPTLPDVNGIDLLAERVAEAVKLEVHRFFSRKDT